MWTSPTIAKALQHKDDYLPDPMTLRFGSVFAKSSKAAPAPGTFVNFEQPTAKSRKLQRGSWILSHRSIVPHLSQVHLPRYLHGQLQFLILSVSSQPSLGYYFEGPGQLPLEVTDTRHKDPFLSYWETLSSLQWGRDTRRVRKGRSWVASPSPSQISVSFSTESPGMERVRFHNSSSNPRGKSLT